MAAAPPREEALNELERLCREARDAVRAKGVSTSEKNDGGGGARMLRVLDGLLLVVSSGDAVSRVARRAAKVGFARALREAVGEDVYDVWAREDPFEARM